MNSCIYLFDKEKDLTYEKKEHIFSAGIGGRSTLPTGYVSDQANELFSSYELKCLRYSPLMIARVKYGPGKRGFFNVNHIDVPDVLSLKPETKAKERDVICPLGFLFMDQAYPIPQMIIMLDGILARPKKLHIKPQYETLLKTSMESFPIQLKQFC